jgi:CO/xanthine dehydrogenase FAD-binding subunit
MRESSRFVQGANTYLSSSPCRQNADIHPVLDRDRPRARDGAMQEYAKAGSLDDALAMLETVPAGGGSWQVVAGGTDIYPIRTARAAWLQPAGGPLLDVSALAEMHGIALAGGYRIGALTTWSDILAAPLPPAFDGLKAAARQVGGVQIQNRGTIGGNLCNASPAADGVPPLLALDAEVELTSAIGVRRMALSEFIVGNRRTELTRGELLTAVIVPEPPAGDRSVFLKLGARAYLVISIASVAANLALDRDGRIAAARLAVGACSAAPLRLPRVEAALLGRRPAEAVIALTPEDGLAPIDDVRASAAYRLAAAGTLLRRAVASFAPGALRAA